jgi:putative DNA primase/helicase
MSSAADILQEHHVGTKSSAPGRYYTTCPQCSHKRRKANQRLKCLGVTIDSEGVKFGCNHCGWTGGGRYGGTQTVSRHAAATVLPPPQTNGQNSDAERTARALELWNEAEPLCHTALAYLASRGVLELPLPDVDSVLRFHSGCPFGPGERHPCILALLRDVITNEPTGIHRTALTGTGQKLGRMTLGVKSGAAIKLWSDEGVTLGLVVGEGLETVLSAATRIEHRGTLLRPAWALSDAGNMAAFPVLPGIDALTILVDHDESGTGQQAARTCAERWAAEGREVILLTPHDAGADFNDLTRAIP